MKVLLSTFLILGTLNGFASDYKCKAILIEDMTQDMEMDSISGNILSAKINSFQFSVVQTDDETLVVSIFNRARREQAATATTFVPKKNKPSNLSLRLAIGKAEVECNSLEI